jgi:AraC-like DNA-binding protein
VIFFLPFQTKLSIYQSIWHSIIFTYLGIVYSLAIAIWNLKLLNKHRIDVHNIFSYVESKELQWARMFLVYSIITAVIIHILYAISPTNPYFKIIYSVFDLIAIYWVSYQGIKQRNIVLAYSKEKSFITPELPSSEISPGPNHTDDLESLMELIDQYMQESEIFIHTELTIVDLAKNLNVHPKRISTAINTVRQLNFNSYVNRFRIKKAEKLLENQEHQNLSVEGIGNEVGFHSKSAFYTAFKKETGTTPVKFKERIVA